MNRLLEHCLIYFIRKVGRPRIYGDDYLVQDDELPKGLSRTEKKRLYSRRRRHLKLTSSEADE